MELSLQHLAKSQVFQAFFGGFNYKTNGYTSVILYRAAATLYL